MVVGRWYFEPSTAKTRCPFQRWSGALWLRMSACIFLKTCGSSFSRASQAVEAAGGCSCGSGMLSSRQCSPIADRTVLSLTRPGIATNRMTNRIIQRGIKNTSALWPNVILLCRHGGCCCDQCLLGFLERTIGGTTPAFRCGGLWFGWCFGRFLAPSNRSAICFERPKIHGFDRLMVSLRLTNELPIRGAIAGGLKTRFFHERLAQNRTELIELFPVRSDAPQ